MTDFPSLVRTVSASGEARYRLGDPLVDRYLEFVAGRSRPNTLRAVAFDLKAFFSVVEKAPVEVEPADVFEFLAAQRGDRTVVRLADRESGASARTLARRLSSVSGFYAYAIARGDTAVRVNPVPRGLATRRQGDGRGSRVPLVRVPRTLPKILTPQDADRLVMALRTHRDRAMVLAMLLAGLRRCEVLGLRFPDVRVADRRLVITEGKGGHHRVVPVANRFFDALGAYLHDERPANALTDRVFVVLKGPNRGLPFSPSTECSSPDHRAQVGSSPPSDRSCDGPSRQVGCQPGGRFTRSAAAGDLFGDRRRQIWFWHTFRGAGVARVANETSRFGVIMVDM